MDKLTNISFFIMCASSVLLHFTYLDSIERNTRRRI